MTNPAVTEGGAVCGVAAKGKGGDSGNAGKERMERVKKSLVPPKTPLTRNLSRSQLKEFREAFRLFDKDGDGTITSHELGLFMRNLGQFATEEELRVMVDEVDIDGDGTFSFNEFVEIVCNMGGGGERPAEDEEKELRDAFKIFDKHERGYICASDLRAVLQCLGEDLSEEEIEDMIREVDIDGDGRIDFEEFVKALGENDDSDDEEEARDEDEDEERK
ncbi:neo-calmodulin-like [Portunus trituberculatus]|uniref:neo-calmodulin-like n=1 Tax=Portunus trituberculatus TaxID=210409 RepID=UPI001E1CC28F|nr:neo-calmodulin-like [Portunus trituberculatus]